MDLSRLHKTKCVNGNRQVSDIFTSCFYVDPWIHNTFVQLFDFRSESVLKALPILINVVLQSKLVSFYPTLDEFDLSHFDSPHLIFWRLTFNSQISFCSSNNSKIRWNQLIFWMWLMHWLLPWAWPKRMTMEMCPHIRALMRFSSMSSGFWSVAKRYLQVCNVFDQNYGGNVVPKITFSSKWHFIQVTMQQIKPPPCWKTKSTLKWIIWMSVSDVTRTHTLTQIVETHWQSCVMSRTSLFGSDVVLIVIIGQQKWYHHAMANCWSVSLAITPVNLSLHWNALYSPKIVAMMRLLAKPVHRIILHWM